TSMTWALPLPYACVAAKRPSPRIEMLLGMDPPLLAHMFHLGPFTDMSPTGCAGGTLSTPIWSGPPPALLIMTIVPLAKAAHGRSLRLATVVGRFPVGPAPGHCV